MIIAIDYETYLESRRLFQPLIETVLAHEHEVVMVATRPRMIPILEIDQAWFGQRQIPVHHTGTLSKREAAAAAASGKVDIWIDANPETLGVPEAIANPLAETDLALPSEFDWKAVADDDFTARHGDYVLRAEEMDTKSWWWCVYFGKDQIDQGWGLQTSKQAMRAAETVARYHHFKTWRRKQ